MHPTELDDFFEQADKNDKITGKKWFMVKISIIHILYSLYLLYYKDLFMIEFQL